MSFFRTTPPTVDAPDTSADKLEVNVLAAVALTDAILGGWSRTHSPQLLVDGLLDIRNRLAKGLAL